ncbi:AMP-binding protein [Blastococcus brunescens]|uniref:AMP-binding protein n=1 Tax=Blastococcus brunescens TaxID=1564165 RepID=A0ABZ1AZM4_9ACTN|nr:AMP-binding protein [Blastococcus sp. BMG 8361]WRL63381.1 AMP-binding protein [Blastococcus sp. BMG 8361]
MPEPRIHTSEYPPVDTPATPIWSTVLAGAAERGDHPALIDGISGQTITYAQLAHMVERMAAGFAENGVQPGTSSRCTARTRCCTRWSSTRPAGPGPR